MFKTLAIIATACILAPLTIASVAAADPEPGPPPIPPAADAVPLPPGNAVTSAKPSIYRAPDGSTLTVGANSETQVAVPPLTTATSSREYLVGATFTGSVREGKTNKAAGTFEVGYQVGCGIIFDRLKIVGQMGVSTAGTTMFGLIPTGISFPISGTLNFASHPGEVQSVAVDKKPFNGNDTAITVKDIHIKIDGCVGQSFLRSYAILTSSTDTADSIATYYGVTKAV